MEKINGQPLIYYGLVLVGFSGILDMPPRIGDLFYDWGDELQPLADDADIHWSSKDFSMNVLFDSSRTTKTFKTVITELSALTSFSLESKYGNYTVKIKEIRSVKHYQSISTFTIVFHQSSVVFNQALPTKITGTPSIDGYSFEKNLNIIVSKSNVISDLPSLKSSNTTVFNSSKPLSKFRGFQVLEIDCFNISASKRKILETTEQLKKILSQNGYRTIILNSETYSCFFTEGFKVSKTNQFKLRFNIV